MKRFVSFITGRGSSGKQASTDVATDAETPLARQTTTARQGQVPAALADSKPPTARAMTSKDTRRAPFLRLRQSMKFRSATAAEPPPQLTAADLRIKAMLERFNRPATPVGTDTVPELARPAAPLEMSGPRRTVFEALDDDEQARVVDLPNARQVHKILDLTPEAAKQLLQAPDAERERLLTLHPPLIEKLLSSDWSAFRQPFLDPQGKFFPRLQALEAGDAVYVAELKPAFMENAMQGEGRLLSVLPDSRRRESRMRDSTAASTSVPGTPVSEGVRSSRASVMSANSTTSTRASMNGLPFSPRKNQFSARESEQLTELMTGQVVKLRQLDRAQQRYVLGLPEARREIYLSLPLDRLKALPRKEQEFVIGLPEDMREPCLEMSAGLRRAYVAAFEGAEAGDLAARAVFNPKNVPTLEGLGPQAQASVLGMDPIRQALYFGDPVPRPPRPASDQRAHWPTTNPNPSKND